MLAEKNNQCQQIPFFLPSSFNTTKLVFITENQEKVSLVLQPT